MRNFEPNYDVYRSIIKDIKQTNKYCDYIEACNQNEFIIMRHDVEFSLERAYMLSMIESEEDFRSTYFIQLTNNSYNALSGRNMKLIRDMKNRGHHIGLHYHLNGELDPVLIRDGVRDQIRIMTEMLGFPIDRFSFHRPVKEMYYFNISIPNIINAYSPDFFTYVENVTENDDLEIKYISDSKHRWNYGFPDYETLMKYKKIQLLIHPFSWIPIGYNNENNFYYLIREKGNELIDTLSEEFQRFQEVKDQILDRYKDK